MDLCNRTHSHTLIEMNTLLLLTVHALSCLVLYHHHLFMIIIIVNLAVMDKHKSQMFPLVTQYGMVRAVPVITIVALSPTCHGSIVSYHSLPMKILRHDFAVMNHHPLKMFSLKNFSCMYFSRFTK